MELEVKLKHRLRALRDESGLTGAELARRLGEKQQWVSAREATGPSGVRLTVEDAVRYVRALGRSAGLVIAPDGADDLVESAVDADPELVGLAVRMLRNVDRIENVAQRRLVLATLRHAISQAEEAAEL
jgi:transcriptional regulator with XRE-family HTH domain